RVVFADWITVPCVDPKGKAGVGEYGAVR
ncbi:MAG: hypothetical protein ACI89L_001072, partial [Phycisphaerales bacterium]